jgi:drug/metabolite transporter (DMT)-like permease
MNKTPDLLDGRSGKLVGRAMIVVSAVLWSTSGLFAKSPVFSSWPVDIQGWAVRGPTLAFWRAAFACVILFPLVRRPRWTVRLIPAALIFTVMNFTFLTSMTTTTAANAIWLQYTAPLWVFLFGTLVVREPVDPRNWLTLLFGMVGVGVILTNELQGQAWIGVIYGLLAGISYAAVVITLRWLREEDAAWVVAINHMVTALLFLPHVAYFGIWPNGHQFAYLAAFGMLQMGLPYFLFARGIRSVASQEATGIALLEPVLVPVWVVLAWRHHPDYSAPAWSTLAGGACILIGLLLRYRTGVSPPQSRAEQSKESE